MTTRRSFLGAVAAAMASMAMPAVAQTLAQQQIAQHGFAFDRYQVALQKFDLIVEMQRDALAANPGSRGLDINISTMMFDDLLAYLFAEFPDVSKVTFTPELHQQCRFILEGDFSTGPSIDDLLRTTPSPIIDALWPVALAKEVLRTHRMQFDHRACSAWNKFVSLYRSFVMGPDHPRVNCV